MRVNFTWVCGANICTSPHYSSEHSPSHHRRNNYLPVFPLSSVLIAYVFGLLDPDRKLFVQIRILPSTSKKIKKNLDFYCFVTFYDFLSLKNYVNLWYFHNGISIKSRIFFGFLKVTDEEQDLDP
jgi:hypothetical protein